jgi:excisionase family DNA binding protein
MAKKIDVKIEDLPLRATGVAGIAKMYGISESTVERAIRLKELPVCRCGRRVVVRIEDAERWIGSAS